MRDVPSVKSDQRVQVRYVGLKDRKYDNICHTQTIWNGHGDVQLVPMAVAAQLAQFPKVWEVVFEGASVKQLETAADPKDATTRFANGTGDHDDGVSTVEALPKRAVLKLQKNRT